MATLLELRGLFNDSDLHDKVQAALIIKIQERLAGTPTANEQKYAGKVFEDPANEAIKALMSVLAANSGATVGAIQGATDDTIKTQVGNVIDTLVTAYIG